MLLLLIVPLPPKAFRFDPAFRSFGLPYPVPHCPYFRSLFDQDLSLIHLMQQYGQLAWIASLEHLKGIYIGRDHQIGLRDFGTYDTHHVGQEDPSLQQP